MIRAAQKLFLPSSNVAKACLLAAALHVGLIVVLAIWAVSVSTPQNWLGLTVELQVWVEDEQEYELEVLSASQMAPPQRPTIVVPPVQRQPEVVLPAQVPDARADQPRVLPNSHPPRSDAPRRRAPPLATFTKARLPRANDEVDVPARITHGSRPRYPVEALAAGKTGSVLIEVRVSDSGLPTMVRLLRSSGHAALDRAALAHVRRHWRWRPAKRDGLAVAQVRKVEIDFRLRSNS